MSRHTLTPTASTVTEVAVGWDHPMGTYFAQAFGPDEDTPLLDQGDPLDRITDPAMALDAIRAYAAIPDELEHQLLNEAHASRTAQFTGGEAA